MSTRIWGAIFDYVDTLRVRESNELYPEVVKVLLRLRSLGVRIAVVSAAGSQTVAEREAEIHAQPIYDLADYVLVSASPAQKDAHCDELLDHFELPTDQIVVVDDRIDRCIQWGNRRGCLTIRVRRQGAKFSDREPEHANQQPDYTITTLEHLIDLIDAIEHDATDRITELTQVSG